MVGRSRVEIHPLSLMHAADRLDAAARLLATSRDRLMEATDTVAINPGDPRIRTSPTHDRVGVIGYRLTVAGREYEVDGALCRSTASEARTADTDSADGADRSVVCRIPHCYRRPLDQAITIAVGDGIDHAVKASVSVIERLVPGLVESTSSNNSGDLGGTFTTRPVALESLDEPNVVTLSLAATNDQQLLANDEFGLIDHGDQRFTVVLHGVTDLSMPGRGLNKANRTVRDLDEVALSSARSAGVENNRYAGMVMAALEQNDVGHGAKLLLVGHSFGADTALDLAACGGVLNSR